MIITCTNCKTSFVTAEASIGASGRKVKCSKCHSVWFVSLPTYETNHLTINNIADIAVESVKLPTISIAKNSIYMYLTLIIIIIALAIAGILFFPSQFIKTNIINKNWLCQNLAVCETEGIRLKDVSLTEVSKNHKKILVLSYKIANSNSESKLIPPIQVRLLDNMGKVIKSHLAINQNVILKPLNQHLVETRFEDLPANIQKIELDIGNRLELILR